MARTFSPLTSLKLIFSELEIAQHALLHFTGGQNYSSDMMN
jgi:hypothetical protein